MGTAAHAQPISPECGNGKSSQCEESRFRPHQAKARPATPTSSTPAMMDSSPGPPNSPEPSFRDIAAAWVGFADFVSGVSQLDAANGLAEVGEGDAAMVMASGVGVSSTAETVGSGSTVSTGAGAGAGSAGTGGAVGTGAVAADGDAGVGVPDGGSVGFPVPVAVGGVVCPPGRSPQTTPQPGPVTPSSAWAGAAADKPTVSASTAMAAAATPRGAEEDRIMVTFADGARHPSAAN
jgi:hypothetical protein